MRRFLRFTSLLLALPAACHVRAETQEKAPRETVVVLHGLGRGKFSMSRVARHLRREGYDVLNLSYPSTRMRVAEAAGHLHRELASRLPADATRVHFVTHSLGGLVVRAYLKDHRPENLGRVVMLAPPNQGSEVADRMRKVFFYRWFTGPAGQEMGTDAASLPNSLGAVDFPLGVIAGSRSFNPLFSAWLDGEDDGKVAVARTRVAGMSDFLVVPTNHTFIVLHARALRQVTHFLAHGRFTPPDA
jgi:pimeloyl-ACP methyl ester carboxylesterase